MQYRLFFRLLLPIIGLRERERERKHLDMKTISFLAFDFYLLKSGSPNE